MPLLKGKFRPALKTARSRTTSEGEGVRDEHNNTLCSPGGFQRGPSAFKVPASPIVVGLTSPKMGGSNTSPGFFHTSPRKTPTTPFSPRCRPLSPHFIQPPIPIPDTSPVMQEESALHEDDPMLPLPSRLETISASVPEKPSKASDSEHEGSSDEDARSIATSVSSYQESDGGTVTKKPKRQFPVKIDRTVMTMADLIKIRVPKDGDNPLTKIWSDIKEREEAAEKLKQEKQEEKDGRIKQLIEEAKARGENLTQQDIDEEELPPIEVEMDKDGKIVINQKSLEVKPQSQTDIQETVVEDQAEITFGRYEDHKVCGMSYSRRKKTAKIMWSENETCRFYLALRKVGTDFDLMHKIMPQYSRDQLKRKFKREEKLRLPKIDMALSYSMRLSDEALEPAPVPDEPVAKKKPKKLPKEKKAPRKKPAAPKRNTLSDSDEETRPSRRSRRASRPLRIDDSEDASMMIAMMRDDSLDRKIVL